MIVRYSFFIRGVFNIYYFFSLYLFKMLSGGLSVAVNGFWEVADADQGKGVVDFEKKGELWKKRRALSKNFWAE